MLEVMLSIKQRAFMVTDTGALQVGKLIIYRLLCIDLNREEDLFCKDNL